jgi:linoleoyl-CoA desaturase
VLVSSLLTLSWILYGEWRAFFSGHIGRHPLPRPTWVDAAVFVGTKLAYRGSMLALPACFHPVPHVLLAFVAMHLLFGVTLSLVFQLAHTVELNAFPVPEPHTGRMAHAWAVHEVETTANVAPTHRWACWYLGGLHFQIEHHLFPAIYHIHYPAMSTIVRQTCHDFALPYVCYPTIQAALVGHYRWLQTLGRGGDPRATTAAGQPQRG